MHFPPNSLQRRRQVCWFLRAFASTSRAAAIDGASSVLSRAFVAGCNGGAAGPWAGSQTREHEIGLRFSGGPSGGITCISMHESAKKGQKCQRVATLIH
eukprot:COSAG03_NODE_3045_length_2269_cov_3.607834_2_plen_99_part_00